MAPAHPVQHAAPGASIAAPAEPNRPVEGELLVLRGAELPLFLPSPETADEETESEIELEMEMEEDEVEYIPPPPPQKTGQRETARSDGEWNILEEVEAEPQSGIEPERRHDNDPAPEEASSLAQPAPLVSDPSESEDSNDALLLRIVLAQPVNGTTARSRIAFWDAVATAFTSAGGMGVASRADVTKRLGVLTLMLFESPHLLIPSLRAMVLEFNEQNCRAGFAAHLSDALLTALRMHATDGGTTAALTRRPRSPHPDSLKTKAVEDEYLVRLVMQHKPFEVDRKYRTNVWVRICDDYNAALGDIRRSYARGSLNARVSGERRLVAAMAALLNREYPDDARTQRAMLVEYHILSIPGNAETIPAGTDELFMRFVLEKRPYSVALPARTQAWEDVVAAFVAAGGDQIEGSSGATRHVAKLTKMLRERPQVLSEQLRGMVLDYNEQRYASGKWKTDVAILESLRKNVREAPVGTVEAFRPPEQGTISPQAINPPAEDAVDEQADEQQDRAVANEEPMALDVVDGERALTCTRTASASTTEEDTSRSDDELLMRTVLAHRPVETTVIARTSGWDTVVDAFNAVGGANVTTRADVTRRIGVMTLMLFESPHLLTPRLREMVLEFNESNCKAGFAQRLCSAFLKTLRTHTTEGTTVHGHSNERHGMHAEREQEGRERAREDEHLMRIMMKHRPFEAGAEGKTLYWIKILSEYNATLESADNSHRGLLRSGISALQYVLFATTALLNQTHWYHAFLSPRLRAMLLEYNMLNIDIACEMHRRPVQADPVSVQRTVMQVEEDKPATPHTTERSELTRLAPRLEPAFRVASASSKTVDKPPQDDEPETVGLSSSGYAAVIPSLDERLMRLVLDELPFCQPSGAKTAAWDKLSNAWMVAAGTEAAKHLHHGNALARVKYLRVVYRDRSHREHDKLTKPLKDLLREYTTAKGKRKGDRGLHKKHYQDNIRSGKRSRAGQVEEMGSSPQQHTKIGKKTSTDVARISQPMNPAPGGDVGLTRGGMGELTATRNKRRASQFAQEGDIARRKRRRTTNSDNIDASGDDVSTVVDETAFRVALEKQPFLVAYGLRRDAWDQVAWEVNRQIGRRTFFQTGAYIQTHINRVLARLENDPESVSTTIRELASQYTALLPSTPTKRQSRSPTTTGSASSLSLNSRGPEAPRSSTQEALQRAQPPKQYLASGVEAEMALLRESISRLSEQVAVLIRDAAKSSNEKDSELAEARAETKQLVEEFKLERREIREHQNALVELLRSERETQRCETRAMLDAIDRERKGSRDEFIALANLMTRSVQPASAMQDNHEIDVELDPKG